VPGSIIPFPDATAVREEILALQEELVTLYTERDTLVSTVCPNIESRYMLVLGALEFRVYQAYVRFLRTRRKYELMQAQVNRQEAIRLNDIESRLEQEFASYRAELEERMGRMNEALRRHQAKELSEAESAEHKRLYRSIVKRLHPDLNPQLTAAERGLFERAVTAYGDGDLDSLRIIHAMLTDLPSTLETAGWESVLSERERLQRLIALVQNEIETIKSSWPYTMLELLEDSGQLARKRTELEDMLEYYVSVTANYEARIETLLGAK